MNILYYQIKDQCRAQLLPFLEQALAKIQLPPEPRILDVGCGTGVPTLFLTEQYGGTMIAADPDNEALGWLNRKIRQRKLNEQITARCATASELRFPAFSFDLILAEGLLNVIGFETGISLLFPWIKREGYLVIHDENARHEEKLIWAKHTGFLTIASFLLDNTIWWNHYYACLEQVINRWDHPDKESVFAGELNEISLFRANPLPFQSRYYILMKSSVNTLP